ncbi:hypothetical protein AAAC51_29135 [Priestia megaterium]
MAVYKRRYKDETTFVVINNTKETSAINVPLKKVGKENELRGLITEGIIRPVDDVYNISLEPETTNVYKVVKKSGFNIDISQRLLLFIRDLASFCTKHLQKEEKKRKFLNLVKGQRVVVVKLYWISINEENIIKRWNYGCNNKRCGKFSKCSPFDGISRHCRQLKN